MRRTALILAAASTVTFALTTATPASAATSWTVKWCANGQPNPPALGGGWSTQLTGSAFYPASAPRAFVTPCANDGTGLFDWYGPGGAFGDGTTPGSQALAKFVPPSGSVIIRMSAGGNIIVSSGAYAEAGAFAASTGRALGDNSDTLNGDGRESQGIGNYSADSIGADGAQGLLFGARCPASLPAGAGGQCGAAGAGFGDLNLDVNDPSAVVLNASATLDAAGRAAITWSASDPQSGVAEVRVDQTGCGAGGCASNSYPSVCTSATAPPCETTVSGSQTTQLNEGQTSTFTVVASPPGGDPTTGRGEPTTKAFTLTRTRTSTPTPTPTPVPTDPTPAPTTPAPTPTPSPVVAKVTLRAKSIKGGRVALSGTARGCTRVSIKVPRSKRSQTAKVKSGKWSLTTKRTRGTYRASCGKAIAMRAVR